MVYSCVHIMQVVVSSQVVSIVQTGTTQPRLPQPLACSLPAAPVAGSGNTPYQLGFALFCNLQLATNAAENPGIHPTPSDQHL